MKHRARAGFTLVEVLVALAVLAIALPALMISISEQVNGFSHLRDKSIAHWIAMDKMTQLRLQNQVHDYLPKDRKRGSVEMLGREWYWQLDTQKTANEALREVELTIREEQKEDSPALATALNYFVLPLPNTPGSGGTGNNANPGNSTPNTGAPSAGTPSSSIPGGSDG